MRGEMLMGAGRGRQTIFKLSSPQFLAGIHLFRSLPGNGEWIPANWRRE
jgi:hypothetical protein